LNPHRPFGKMAMTSRSEITTGGTVACDKVNAAGGSDRAAAYRRRLYFPATITVARLAVRIETATVSSAPLKFGGDDNSTT
jgi:hypothetical protein